MPVGVCEMEVVQGSETVLTCGPIGAGIGVTLYDPLASVGGIVHFILPHPQALEPVSSGRLATFATTALPELFRRAYDLGAHKSNMVVCATGGAKLLDDEGEYQLGPRSRTLMRKLLWTNGVRLAVEDVGGTGARWLRLDMFDGMVTSVRRGEETLLWTP